MCVSGNFAVASAVSRLQPTASCCPAHASQAGPHQRARLLPQGKEERPQLVDGWAGAGGLGQQRAAVERRGQWSPRRWCMPVQTVCSQASAQLPVFPLSLTMQVNDDELSMVLFRSQEISRYVEDGVLDGEMTTVWVCSRVCCHASEGPAVAEPHCFAVPAGRCPTMLL